MRRSLFLLCLLLAVPACAQTDAHQAAAVVLSKFFKAADSRAPQTQIECSNLIRPALLALGDFKKNYPGMFPEFVAALDKAALEYDQGCRALWRGAPPAWERASENVYAAEQHLVEATPKSSAPVKQETTPASAEAAAGNPPPAAPNTSEKPQTTAGTPTNAGAAEKSPATPAPEAKPKEAEKPSPSPGTETKPKEPENTEAKPASEPKPAETPPSKPGQVGDLKVVEKAQAVLQLVQKLDSAFDLALGKEELQSRLVDAHAAVQEFAGSPESEALPLTVTNLRLAVAYYRRRLGTDDAFATASAKDALQNAREYLNNYKTTGQEQPAKP